MVMVNKCHFDRADLS